MPIAFHRGFAFLGTVAAVGLMVSSAQAADFSKTMPDATSVASINAASPANVAGALNYCIETDAVSDEDGTPTLVSLSKKSNAVPADQSGNMDYAYGTAGQFFVGGKATTMASMPHDEQKKLCGAVLSRAKSSI